MNTREIKFRAWDKKRNEMLQPLGNDIYDLLNGIDDIYFRENCIFLQYTGLKDKNSMEIYEWDVVKHKNPEKTGIVMFGEYSDRIGNHYGWYIERILKIGGYKSETIIDFITHEVIGNIWENPELLPANTSE